MKKKIIDSVLFGLGVAGVLAVVIVVGFLLIALPAFLNLHFENHLWFLIYFAYIPIGFGIQAGVEFYNDKI